MEILTKYIKYTVLSLLLIVTGKASAQISFVKVYSGNGYDRGEGVCQLSDSSYLVTGTSSSFEDAPSQAFIMRVDSMGNFKWSKAYGGSESETGKRIIAFEGFGYYVAGTSSSSGTGDFDNYLFFTDEDGEQQWEVFTDKGGWERVNDATSVPSDTSIITVGQTDAAADFINDIYICRYSKTGQLMWDVTAGTPGGNDVANAVQMLSDTSFVVAGTYYVADSLTNKAYLALYHINGSLIWKKTFGDNGSYALNDISLADGWLINAVGESVKPGYSDYDSYVIRCLYDGSYFGNYDYHVDNSIRMGTVVQYQPGISGKHFVSEQTINPDYTFEDGEDVLIHRNTQEFNWDGYGASFSGVGQDQINQMITTSDHYAAAVGFNTTYGGGGNCVLLVKIGDDNIFPVFTTDPTVVDIVSLSENEAIENLIVYPNPVVDHLTIKLDGKQFSYNLTDLSGRRIAQGNSFGQESIDLGNEPQGVYLLKVFSDNKEMVLKIVR